MENDVEQPIPMGAARKPQQGGTETDLRVLKPSARAAIPSLVYWLGLAGIITWAIFHFDSEVTWLAGMVARILDDAFPYDSWFLWLLGGVWVLCLLPPMWRLLVLKTTQYEFTSQRLLYHRGVFNREHDQIELWRIRDVKALRPFYLRPLGIGRVRLDTVDRTHPEFYLEYQKRTYALSDWIHSLNVQERERLGYREYEGTQSVV